MQDLVPFVERVHELTNPLEVQDSLHFERAGNPLREKETQTLSCAHPCQDTHHACE